MKGGKFIGYVKRGMKEAARRNRGNEQQKRWKEIDDTFKKARESVREYEKQKK